MNNEQIELLQNEINFLEIKIKETKELSTSLYRNGYEHLRNVFKEDYELSGVKSKLEKKLELYKMITEKVIDVSKRYYLFGDIYLSINDLSPYFYIDGGQWIYDNYINSWSGINEWITDLIDQEYSLFSGNSPYCHAFGTMSIKEIFKYIENEKNPNDKKITLIENLIEFTKDNGKYKDIHDQVVESIKFKLNMMKENINNN